MAEPYATAGDVAKFLKVTFDQADTEQCEMVLAAVSAGMRSQLPALDTWITAGLTDPILAKFCAITLAKDCIHVVDVGNVKAEQHPEHAITFRDFTDEDDIEVPDSWIQRLTPHTLRSARGRAFSIRPGSG